MENNKSIKDSGQEVSREGGGEILDVYGHHTIWKFCPGCGIDWMEDEGFDQFGCSSCGYVRRFAASTPTNKGQEREATTKAAELINALLSGKTLVHQCGQHEDMISTLHCEIQKDVPFFWVQGWGTAYGTSADRILSILKYPEKWSIEGQEKEGEVKP